MGDRGTHFAFAARHQITEQGKGQFAPDAGEGVAVEEKKWGFTMKPPETIPVFRRGSGLAAGALPTLARTRFQFPS
jgi:hypothetical protein